MNEGISEREAWCFIEMLIYNKPITARVTVEFIVVNGMVLFEYCNKDIL